MRRFLWIWGLVIVILVLAGASFFARFLGTRLAPGEVFRVHGPDVLLIGEPAIVSWEAVSTEAAALASVKIEFCSGGECITLNPDTPNDGKAQVFVPSMIAARRGALRLTARETPRGELLAGVGTSRGVEVRRGTQLSPGDTVQVSWRPDSRYPEVKIEFCVPQATGEECGVLAYRAANTGLSPVLTVRSLQRRAVGTVRVRARDTRRQLVLSDSVRLLELPAAVLRPANLVAGGGNVSEEAREGPYFEESLTESSSASEEPGGQGSQASVPESSPFTLQVSDIVASQVGESSFTVSFNTTPAANEGRLYVRRLGQSEWTVHDNYPVPSSTFTYTATGLEGGTTYEYKVWAGAYDPACQQNCQLVIAESQVLQVTTTAEERADLVIDSVDSTVKRVGHGPNPKYRVTFETVVKNRGTHEADNSRTLLEVDTDQDGDVDRADSNATSEIGAGLTEDESWTMQNFEVGTITARVCADTLDDVHELDETNNCRTVEVVVAG